MKRVEAEEVLRHSQTEGFDKQEPEPSDHYKKLRLILERPAAWGTQALLYLG